MKEIADGFVRAKKLENFRTIACNAETGSLTQCISNLAFIPNLKVIDTYETSGYFFSDLDIESFLKVLKISGSIEYIRFSKNFNNHLRMFTRKDVCLALAHNKTIKTLDIQGKNNFVYQPHELARAIAVNAKLGNSLEEVDIEFGIQNNMSNLEVLFFSYMNVSEQEVAQWRELYEEA